MWMIDSSWSQTIQKRYVTTLLAFSISVIAEAGKWVGRRFFAQACAQNKAVSIHQESHEGDTSFCNSLDIFYKHDLYIEQGDIMHLKNSVIEATTTKHTIP